MNIFKKNIIIVQIAEGLGNQLFCYATARALSLKNNKSLYLDTYSQFRINKYNRKYLLDNYNIQGIKLSKFETLLGNIGHVLWKTKLITKKRFKIFYLEQNQKLDEDLLRFPISSNIYLLGYWQHEEYFTEYSFQIRSELQRISIPSEECQIIAKKIKLTTSVCIHIRSYNEIGEPKMPKAYLENAIEYINTNIQNPFFYIFTDDHIWVSKNFKVNGHSIPILCNQNGDGAMDDLWLMAQCDHHILTSSSFGWWAAWLANNEKGIITLPQDSGLVRNGTFQKSWILL